MLIFKGLFSLGIIILLAVSVLFIDFTYKTFSVRQRNIKTDAIVVLAGGRGRVEEGIRLYRDHRSRFLFLIGVDRTVRKADLFKERNGDGGSDRVILEKMSRNTHENALYSRDMILDKGVESITLITSRYHMKRSVLIFRHTLPGNIAIYPHPVDTANLKEEWWNHLGSFRLLFAEFYKYCLFRFFFLLSPPEMQPAPKNIH